MTGRLPGMALGAVLLLAGLATASLPGASAESEHGPWAAHHFLLWWGRESEALDVFRLNVDLNPASAKACAGLGEALLVLGRKEEAGAALRKALELDPEMPGVKAALDALTEKKDQNRKEESH
jgi:tetratricopeptide (TPR) repeat protein